MSNIFTDENTKSIISKGLKFFGDNWILAIIACLEIKELRFGELEKTLNANPRTLSAKLKLLEQKGVLERIEGIKDQQSVEYRLTKKGRDILPVLQEIKHFIDKHGID